MVTLFNNGYYFDEVVGYKKDLFKALKEELPTISFNKDDLIDEDNIENYSEESLYSYNKEIL